MLKPLDACETGAIHGGEMFSLGNRLFRKVRNLVWLLPAARTPLPLHAWRQFLRRQFGAKIIPTVRAHGLGGKRVLLYSGAMGLKHDPKPLIAASRRMRAYPGIAILVVAEGAGADSTYLSAERAVLAGIPAGNLAAEILKRDTLGVVMAPDDTEGYAVSAVELLNSPEVCHGLAKRSRRYAEANLEIGRISAGFESILEEAVAYRRASI